MLRDVGKTEKQKERTDLKDSGVTSVHRVKFFSNPSLPFSSHVLYTHDHEFNFSNVSKVASAKLSSKGCF